MSLDELLKSPKSNSPWSAQRKRLFRVIGGLSVISLALIGGGLFLFSGDDSEPTLSQEEEAAQAESISQLIQLKEETRSLEKEVQRLEQKQDDGGIKKTVQRAPAKTETRQPRHRRVLSFNPGEGFSQVQTETEDLYIPTGAVFRARLLTPIKTSIDETFVMAEATHEFRMDSDRRIPKGSRLIGTSRLNPVMKSVVVEFNKLVLPEGIETELSGLALSRNALPEIEGLYFSDSLQNYGTALAFGFLGGFADAARTRESTIFGAFPDESVSNHVLAGLSSASFKVAEDMLRDLRNRSVEYVVVPAGEPVFVALTRRYNIEQESAP